MKDAIAYFGFSALLRGAVTSTPAFLGACPPAASPIVTSLPAPELSRGFHSSEPLIRAIHPPPTRHT
jgi:hypothetical protein